MHLDDLRPLALFDGLADEELLALIDARRRGAVRARRGAVPRGRARPSSGGSSWRAGSTWSATSAARRRCSGRWTCPAGGPVGSAPGTSTASISRRAGRAVAGRVLKVPAQSLRELVERLVPVRRTPHRGAVPDRAQLRGGDPAAGGPGRARHPGGRARARDQQPGRGGDPRGRRAAGTPATCCCPPSAGWPRGRSPPTSSSRSTRFAARSSRRRPARTPWPSPIARTPCRPGWLATTSRRDWLIAAAARRGRAWTSRGANGRPRCSTAPRSSRGWNGWRAPLSAQTLLAEVKESTRRISELVAAVKSYSQLDRASMQQTDVAEGLESTLVMLAHRIPGRASPSYATTAPTYRGSRPPPASSTRCGRTSSTTRSTRWTATARFGCRPAPTARRGRRDRRHRAPG